MQIKRKLSKITALALSFALAGAFGTAGYYSVKLPDTITVSTGSDPEIAEYPEISCCGSPSAGLSDSGSHVVLSLFGAIPVKRVEVREAEPEILAAGGIPFGIKLLMKGVMVTGTADVETADGESACPAEDSGIRAGDVICLADGIELTSNSQLQGIIAESMGRSIELTVSRDGDEFTTELEPVFSAETGVWCGGMWVRDSIAGIGTMTFIDRSTGRFGGLGHPICDTDTGEIVPVNSGEAVPVEIIGAARGTKGVPGELRGAFRRGGAIGELTENSESGVFGTLSPEAVEALCGGAEEYPLGYRQDVRTGAAEILTTVEGHSPSRYSIEIESIDYNDSGTKNMVIRITDPELIRLSGGIVQGMSGSPIIQDGRLIGAVTHVFVSDPTRGYGIFAEKMAQ